MTDKVFGMLGLAAKSGKVVSGGDTCERLIRKSVQPLVVLAEDASENTKERFINCAAIREKKTAIRIYGTCEELGKYIGKESRSVLIITDKDFANSIMKLMDCASRENGGGDIGKNQGL